jgi:hypothetical protein
MTSDDCGVTWTTRTSANDGGVINWTSVCWSSEKHLFVAVAAYNASNADAPLIMTSPDGIVWTARTAPHLINWRSVCCSTTLDSNIFCAVGYFGSGTDEWVMISPDGINWESKIQAASNNWMCCAFASDGRDFVALANSGTGNRVMVSGNYGIYYDIAPDNWTFVSGRQVRAEENVSDGNYGYGIT